MAQNSQKISAKDVFKNLLVATTVAFDSCEGKPLPAQLNWPDEFWPRCAQVIGRSLELLAAEETLNAEKGDLSGPSHLV